MIVTFDVIPKNVTDNMPSNTRGVTSTSEGLNTEQIEGWILEASAQICALMARAQVSLESASLPTNPAYQIARTAIIAFATASSLEKGANANDPRIERNWKKWEDAKLSLRDYPNDLGSVVRPDARVKSNVPLERRFQTFRDRRW